MSSNLFNTILSSLIAFCTEHQHQAWLVGGTVRDLVMGRMPGDIDVAVDGDGIALARAFADHTSSAFVPLDDERGTGRVVWEHKTDDAEPHHMFIDLVQLRAPTLEEDLRLRDFTINALALPLSAISVAPTAMHITLSPPESDIIDPCGGLHDIASRTLRPCTAESLRSDPVRIMRAVRLAAALEFAITPELEALMRQDGALINRAAAERVRDELLKLLSLPSASPWLHSMDEVGILTRIFPELESSRNCEQPIVHFLPVLEHILETVTCVEWLLAGLFHSDGKDELSRDEHASVSRLPIAVQCFPDLPRTLPHADQFRVHFAQQFGGGQSRAVLLKLAALLHDNAKPQTKRNRPDGSVTFYDHQTIGAYSAQHIAHRLKLTRHAAAYIKMVVAAHMRPGQLRASEKVTPRAVARFFRDTGDAGPDVLLHGLADHMAARGPKIDPDDWHHHLQWVGVFLDTFWGEPTQEQHRAPIINGHDLMEALNLSPGRQIGDLLREIGDAQAAGEITTRDEALDIARQLMADVQGKARDE